MSMATLGWRAVARRSIDSVISPLRIGLAPIVGFDDRALHLDSDLAELPRAGIVHRALLTSSQSRSILLRASTDGGHFSARLPASGSRCRLPAAGPAAGRETIGLIWRLHMKKALTAACAVTILVALSSTGCFGRHGGEAASSSIARGYRDARGQRGCRGAYRR